MKVYTDGEWFDATLIATPPWRNYCLCFHRANLVNWWTLVGFWVGPSVITDPLVGGQDHAWFGVGGIA